MESTDPEKNPFLLLVQWHPERMSDRQSVFSINIKKSFLEAVRKETIKD
jgi:putative glutamine amidotransferase